MDVAKDVKNMSDRAVSTKSILFHCKKFDYEQYRNIF